VKRHAAVTEPRAVGELLRAIDGYQGHPATTAALELAPHVFLRLVKLRAAHWNEVDFEQALWRIPATRTKCDANISCLSVDKL
jgi:integrase